jgi:hypothetical protein
VGPVFIPPIDVVPLEKKGRLQLGAHVFDEAIFLGDTKGHYKLDVDPISGARYPMRRQ